MSDETCAKCGGPFVGVGSFAPVTRAGRFHAECYVEQARHMLAEVQWGTDDGGNTCPVCGVRERDFASGEPQGHEPSCELAALLPPPAAP